jgi:phosphonoacetaldehyde hydrolase
MIKAVVFDWAGTTVDFGSLAPMAAFVDLFRANGIKATVEQVRIPMGLNKWDHIHAMLSMPEIGTQWEDLKGRPFMNSDVDSLLQEFIPMNKISIRLHSELIPGVVPVFRELISRGIRVGSTTGYTRELMDILVPIAEAQGYSPEMVMCAGDTPEGRPAPYMMERIAEQFGISDPSSIVKVDDTWPGIQEGKNYGAWTVGVVKSGNALGLSLAEWNALSETTQSEKLDAARELISRMEPNFMIATVADLIPVIDELND